MDFNKSLKRELQMKNYTKHYYNIMWCVSFVCGARFNGT
jgi:hypothetical protein